MNCLYTIPLCNFGFAFRHATCVIVKDFGKALLKTKSSPIFFSYKLSERKPLFEIAHCIIIAVYCYWDEIHLLQRVKSGNSSVQGCQLLSKIQT